MNILFKLPLLFHPCAFFSFFNKFTALIVWSRLQAISSAATLTSTVQDQTAQKGLTRYHPVVHRHNLRPARAREGSSSVNYSLPTGIISSSDRSVNTIRAINSAMGAQAHT